METKDVPIKVTIARATDGGFMLFIQRKGNTKTYVFKDIERLVMFARIDKEFGELPEGTIGDSFKNSN